MTTPADGDFESILAVQRTAEMKGKSQLVNLVALQAAEKFVSPQILDAKKKDIDRTIARTQEILQARKELGYVYGSGGTDRVSLTRSPMDWAVVKASPSDVVWSHMKELNKVGFFLTSTSLGIKRSN